MLRLVALMNVRSHVILDARLSPYRGSEMRLAESFVGQIPDIDHLVRQRLLGGRLVTERRRGWRQSPLVNAGP